MLRTIHFTEDCGNLHRQVDFATSSGQPSARRSRPIARALSTLGAALREAPVAHRRYHDLLLRKSSHDAALRRALGIARDEHGCTTTRPRQEGKR
jgi:hypothetical protein